MKDILNAPEIAMSDVYAQYLLGWAYIPLQDLPKYEKAYKKVKQFTPNNKTMNKKESKSKIYVIVGYKPADEAYGQQDSRIFGYCKTKKEAGNQLRILTDEFIPKRLDYTTVDMIGWKYNNDIESYIKHEVRNQNIAEIVRADWEKWGGRRKRLRYSAFSVEEIEELTEKQKRL